MRIQIKNLKIYIDSVKKLLDLAPSREKIIIEEVGTNLNELKFMFFNIIDNFEKTKVGKIN